GCGDRRRFVPASSGDAADARSDGMKRTLIAVGIAVIVAALVLVFGVLRRQPAPVTVRVTPRPAPRVDAPPPRPAPEPPTPVRPTAPARPPRATPAPPPPPAPE